jgi:hypothetical protein
MRRPDLAVRQSVFGPLAAFVESAALHREGRGEASRDALRSAVDALQRAGMPGLERAVAAAAERFLP